MTATISFPVFRRTHRRSLSDLLEDSVAVDDLDEALRKRAR